MITKIDRELAEQIVNTIKDVCDHDINFIAPSGIILASTDSSRVGTFHEIGQQVAASGSVLEVTEDNNFSGTKQGILGNSITEMKAQDCAGVYFCPC